MAARNKQDKEALLLVVDELRRHYDNLADSFNHLRGKALALLVGEVAMVTFLFSSESGSRDQFAVTQVYGGVFLLVGVLAMFYAFLQFLSVISSAQLSHPPETKMTRNLEKYFDNNPVAILEYLKSEYELAIEHWVGLMGVRARRFMWGIYGFSAGSFILIVLKYGVGGIGL